MGKFYFSRSQLHYQRQNSGRLENPAALPSDNFRDARSLASSSVIDVSILNLPVRAETESRFSYGTKTCCY